MRTFVSAMLIAMLAVSAVAQDKPKVSEPIGLQLYSFRDQFKKEGVEKTLDRVKALGIKHAELAGTYGLPNDKFLGMLKERGIEAIAAHFPFERYAKEPEKVAEEAKALGLKYAGVAWIPHPKGPFTEAQTRETAKVFNNAGKVLAAQGIQFFYHNHGYEFEKFEDGTLFDLLMKETDPKLVTFEMDVLWTVFPGQDPAKLLEKYPGRWQLMHLKDLKKGVTGNLSGGTPTTNDVALGTGQVQWDALFKAAKVGGVKYYFIEDESPTVVDQLPVSLKFLEQYTK